MSCKHTYQWCCVMTMFQWGLWSSGLTKSTCLWFPLVYSLVFLGCYTGTWFVSLPDPPLQQHLSCSFLADCRLKCLSVPCNLATVRFLAAYRDALARSWSLCSAQWAADQRQLPPKCVWSVFSGVALPFLFDFHNIRCDQRGCFWGLLRLNSPS